MPHESVVLDTESCCDPYYLRGQERWCKEGVSCPGLWSKTEWVQFLVLVPMSCMTSDMEINFSEHSFPLLQTGNDIW